MIVYDIISNSSLKKGGFLMFEVEKINEIRKDFNDDFLNSISSEKISNYLNAVWEDEGFPELSSFLEVLTIRSYFINSSSKNVFNSIGINPDKYALYGFTLKPDRYSLKAGNALREVYDSVMNKESFDVRKSKIHEALEVFKSELAGDRISEAEHLYLSECVEGFKI